MHHLLVARLKSSFVKIFGEDELEEYAQKFSFNKISDIPFNPLQYLDVENGEVFSIEMTPEHVVEFINPYANILDSTSSINPITSGDLSDVRSICLISKYPESTTIHFCRIFPKNYIARNSFLSFSNSEVQIKTEENLLDFSFESDAFYDGSVRKLYFRRFDLIKPMFKGIELFYRQATDQEISAFISDSLFSADSFFSNSGLEISSVGMRNKKKITYLIDKNIKEILQDSIKRQQYREYANHCEIPFRITSDGKLEISGDQELESALNILMERYYKTHILEQGTMLAGSVRNIEQYNLCPSPNPP